MIPYRKLGDDLDSIIGSFEMNPDVTEWQRSVWRQEGKKKAITHDMLGCDHEKALAFEDGTKVGSLRKKQRPPVLGLRWMACLPARRGRGPFLPFHAS